MKQYFTLNCNLIVNKSLKEVLLLSRDFSIFKLGLFMGFNRGYNKSNSDFQTPALRIIVLLCLVFFSFSSDLFSQTSNGTTGTWLNSGTWTPAIAPDPLDIDTDVTIEGYVTREGALTTRSNTNLTLSITDTLVIKGNLTIGKKGNLEIGSNGLLIIDGDFSSEDQVDVVNGGRMIVTGTVSIPNGSSDFTNNGALYVFDVTGSNFGNNIDAFDCTPITDCVYVKDSLSTIDPGLLDFYEEAVNPIVTIGVDATIAENAGVSTITATLSAVSGLDVTVTGIHWHCNRRKC